MADQQAVRRRCEFLKEVEGNLNQVLKSTNNIVAMIGNTPYQAQILGENPPDIEESGRPVWTGNPEEDARRLTEQIQTFKASVDRVCTILHEEIAVTPQPQRMNRAPYLDGLVYENLREGIAIEMNMEKALLKHP